MWADLWIFIGGKEVYRACCEVAIALYRWAGLAQGVCFWRVQMEREVVGVEVEYLF